MAAIPWASNAVAPMGGRSLDIQTFYEQWHKDDPELPCEARQRRLQLAACGAAADPTKTLSDMMVHMTAIREEAEEQANRDAQEEMDEWIDSVSPSAEEKRRVRMVDGEVEPCNEGYTGDDLDIPEEVMKHFFELHAMGLKVYQARFLAAVRRRVWDEENEAEAEEPEPKRRVQVINNRLHPALDEGSNTFTAADLGLDETVLELFFHLHKRHYYGTAPYGDHMPYEDLEEYILEAAMDCVADQAAAAAVAAGNEAMWAAEAMDRPLG